MVAAWMSARDRRGTGHGVGQPDVERNLRALAGRADEEADAGQRDEADAAPHRFRRERLAQNGLPGAVLDDELVVELRGRRASARPRR